MILSKICVEACLTMHNTALVDFKLCIHLLLLRGVNRHCRISKTSEIAKAHIHVKEVNKHILEKNIKNQKYVFLELKISLEDEKTDIYQNFLASRS